MRALSGTVVVAFTAALTLVAGCETSLSPVGPESRAQSTSSTTAAVPMGTPSDASVSPADATVFHDSGVAFVAFDQAFVSCANGGIGEFVLAHDLKFEYVQTFVVDARGGTHHSIRFRAPDWMGVGTITGDVYEVSNVRHSGFSMDADSLPMSRTFVEITHWSVRGGGAKYTRRDLIHTTVDANGTPQVAIDNDQVRCIAPGPA